jgi:nitroimidazol reductase NimA-like FMN-containing flavoprotein (pyridoxamine 5'-phosphate oxidase superfamily)
MGGKSLHYSFRYQKLIGKGKIALVEDVAEKKARLAGIMRHYSEKPMGPLRRRSVRHCIMKLEVTELACKEPQIVFYHLNDLTSHSNFRAELLLI